MKDLETRRAQMEEKKAEFLDQYVQLRYVTLACKAVGVGRSAPYAWMSQDEAFKLAYEECQRRIDQDILTEIEVEADRRAIDGVQKPITYKGKVTGHYTEYSDVLLMFRAKALNPGKYRDNHKVEHTAGKGLEVLVAELKANRAG